MPKRHVPVLVVDDAVLVVRLLADHAPPIDEHSYSCALCPPTDALWTDYNDLAQHEPTCPWRLAREWVKAYDT